MTDGPGRRERIAVVGSGVSGLTAAWILRRSSEVVLYEQDSRLGGHAHTHRIPVPPASLAIDSGFIVHNERTYPTLLKLFSQLGIRTQETEMSMSITCRGCGLSYAGGKGATGLLAQPMRIADPRYVRLLGEVPRFHRLARAVLADSQADLTWSGFLDAHGFSPYFRQHFAVPLVACVWSTGDEDAGDYPALHLFSFLDHHGMLTVKGSPVWKTVVGGSAAYVDALAAQLGDVRMNTPVTGVLRHDDGVEVTSYGATDHYDRVVLATHPDQALAFLSDATPAEKEDLLRIRYSTNQAVLHRDPAVLPRNPRARASWNLSQDTCRGGTQRVHVSYWMNRLHRLPSQSEPYVVSLNEEGISPASIIATMTYHHPVFTAQAVEAAGRLRTAGGPRLAFAGAYLGWGFHEDGARSGAAAAARFGGSW